MKVVVAGGSGLLGRHLSRELLIGGHEVVVLSREPARAARGLEPGVRIVLWDAATTDAWTVELRGADAIVNLAGASVGTWPWTEQRKRLLRQSRLAPTNALVAAVRQLPASARPPVLVSASGSDQYEGRDAEPATETTPPVDTFLGRLCQDWEATALRAEALGVRVVLLRTSLVIAPEAPALQRLALPFRLFIGGPIASGRQWVSWIDLADAIALVAWALASPWVCGPLNLAAPDPRRQADFARALGSALHRPRRVRTPAAVVRVLLGEQATLLLGSRRVWPAKALEGGYQFRQPDLEASLRTALR
jgi:hypothetical protein